MNDEHEGDQGKARQDGDEVPAVYSVGHADGQMVLSRRSFLEIAAVAAGAVAVAGGGSGCATLAGLGRRGPALAHKNAVTALAVNATGKLLVSGDKDGTIKLWQLPEGALLQSWSAHSSPISSVAILATDDVLWSLDSSGTLKRWRLPEGTEVVDNKAIRGGYGANAFAVANAGTWYAICKSARGFELRSQTTGEALPTPTGFDGRVSAFAPTWDGRLLFIGGADGIVGLWTEGAGVEVRCVKTNGSSVSAMTVDPNGALALSAHSDGRLRSWQVPALKVGATFESPFGKPFSVAIRPQLDIFALGSEKPEIGLWRMAAPTEGPRRLTGHAAAVRATVITPDGSLLISGSDDKTIRLWSLPDGKHLRNLVDLKVNYEYVEGTGYKGVDVYGRTITFTLPCGSPIPPGAVCTCNCVPGSIAIPRNHTQRFNTYGYCTCDLICTCNTVCTCQSVGRGYSYYISYWHPN